METDSGLSLKELFQIIWKGKFIILIVSIIGLALSIVGTNWYENSIAKVTTIISLQWNNIDNGEYPDGTLFNYNDIRKPNLISKVLEENNIDSLSTDELRNAIEITPLFSTSVQSAIEKAISQGTTYSYYATDFKISLEHSKLGLDIETSRNLLTSVIDAFKADYEVKYLKQNSITKVINNDLTTYDYVDIISMYESQIQLIESAINMNIEKFFNYESTTLGMGFNDILIRTKLVKEIHLDQVESRVNAYLLTKNKDLLIMKYTNDIHNLQIDLLKQQQKEVQMQELITNYTGSTETIIIPGMDPSEVLQIDTYYDTLVKDLLSAKNKTIDIQSNISFLETQVSRLQGEIVGVYTPLTPEEEAQEIIKVEEDIALMKTTLSSILMDTDQLLLEHNQTLSSGIIEPLMLPEYESNLNGALYMVAGLVVSLFIGTIFVFIKYGYNGKGNVQSLNFSE